MEGGGVIALAFIKPKIGQIFINDVISGTCFLISSSGLVATCLHNLPAKGSFEIKVCFPFSPDAAMKYNGSLADMDEANDLAKIQLEDCSLIDHFKFEASIEKNQTQVITFGYPAIENFNGLVSKGEVVDANAFKGENRRIQTRFPEVEAGFSGAPLINSNTGNVIGIISDIVNPNHSQRNIQTSFAIPSEYFRALHASIIWEDQYSLLIEEISNHNAVHIKRQRDIGVYDPRLYVNRAIDEALEEFVAVEERLFMLAGQTGVGKTCALLNLIEQSEQNFDGLYLDFRINRDNNLNHLLSNEIRILSDDVTDSLENILLQIERNLSRTLIIICDGMESWDVLSDEYFKSVLYSVRQYEKQSEAKHIKFIFSINKDYLYEAFPAFSPILEYRFTPYNYELFYFRTESIPYFEVGNYKYANDHSELKDVYDKYRSVGKTIFNQRELGIVPNNYFDHWGEAVKGLISNPFLLKAIMINYHGQDAPAEVNGYKIVRSIIENHYYSRLPGYSKTLTKKINALLSKVADKILFADDSSLEPDLTFSLEEISLIQQIAAHTTIINIHQDQHSLSIEFDIDFANDVFFEYFILINIYSQIVELNDRKEILAMLSKYFSVERKYLNALRGLASLGGLWFENHKSINIEWLFYFINNNSTERSQLFTRLFFETIRNNQNYRAMKKEDLLNKENLTEEGARKVLKYIEELEGRGQYEDALDLLQVNEFWESFKENGELYSLYLLSMAFNLFNDNHNITGALEIVNQQIDVQALPASYHAKMNFIKGRCYQFDQNYDSAIATYALSSKEQSEFGFRCAHQLAWVTMMSLSNFGLTSIQLEAIIKKMNNIVPLEKQLDSKLLYATCLYRTDEYGEAENILHEIIRVRRKTRNHHKEGKALRILSELYLFQFEREKALKAIEDAIVKLEKTNYVLSLASAYDTKAQIIGLLEGKLEEAIEWSDKALSIAKGTSKQNTKAVSWSLQIKALLVGLNKDLESMENLLEESKELDNTPFQENLALFIKYLCHSLRDKNYKIQQKQNILDLIKDFEKNGIGWFPDILQFLFAKESEVGQIIDDEVNTKELIDSFIFDQIFRR